MSLRGAKRRSNSPPDELWTARQAGGLLRRFAPRNDGGFDDSSLGVNALTYRQEALTLMMLGQCDQRLIGLAKILRQTLEGKDHDWIPGQHRRHPGRDRPNDDPRAGAAGAAEVTPTPLSLRAVDELAEST
jgi:hypothetical protein